MEVETILESLRSKEAKERLKPSQIEWALARSDGDEAQAKLIIQSQPAARKALGRPSGWPPPRHGVASAPCPVPWPCCAVGRGTRV